MNLFWLAKTARECVKLLNDAHAGNGKMALEATQSMYAALHIAGVELDHDAYALTHSRHSLVRWLASHRSHMRLAFEFHVEELFAEYELRQPGKRHKTVLDGHVERLRHLIDTADLPNSLPDSDESPDEAAVMAWDAALTAKLKAKYDNPANTASFTKTGRLKKRKRKPTPPLVLGTADLPGKVRTIPLCMESDFIVKDADGALSGVASYLNYYCLDKLLGSSKVTTMRTYYNEQEWPEPFASMAA